MRRMTRRITQEQLAELAGVDLTFFQRVETAKTNLSIDVLVKIADALAIAPHELLRPARFRAPRRGRPPIRR